MTLFTSNDTCCEFDHLIPFSSNVCKSVQEPTIFVCILILSFMSILIFSPGCIQILFGLYKTKTLFSSLLDLLVVLSLINSTVQFIFLVIKMKCLLCDVKSNETKEVQNHYLNFHNVDRNNVFFKRLFEDQNNIFRGTSVRCLMLKLEFEDLILFFL